MLLDHPYRPFSFLTTIYIPKNHFMRLSVGLQEVSTFFNSIQNEQHREWRSALHAKEQLITSSQASSRKQ